MKTQMTMTLGALATIGTLMLAPWAVAADTTAQGLRSTEIMAPDQAPDEKTVMGGRPGAQKPIDRTFAQQPPLIPHMVANFDDINLEENQCLSCHDVSTYKAKNAPRIGDSHFKDAKGKIQKTVVHTRYNCVQCHVPQVDAPPLVENTFKGTPVTAKKKK